jgi:hypothetical protein
MTFSNDFEQLLEEYHIEVSDRTRRLIRRNLKSSKRTEQIKKSVFMQIICECWACIYFILSIILKITLGIMTGIVFAFLFFVNILCEFYCVMIIIHITTIVMKQYQSN